MESRFGTIFRNPLSCSYPSDLSQGSVGCIPIAVGVLPGAVVAVGGGADGAVIVVDTTSDLGM
jgi:hypothetical protein